MPTASKTRTISSTPQELWELIRDPHHLPRWWPRVTRVEDVDGDAFTEVLSTAKGRAVRADFHLARADEASRTLTWVQQVEGTPFARLLSKAETEVRLDPEQVGSATSVTIELRQSLNGFFPRFGAYMVRRAAHTTIEEALDGLERIVG
jgi:uncharacterized protein YndB with AHSA1/START domain